MSQLIKTGRVFYSIGLAAFGVQQIAMREFRPEILPPFPAWANSFRLFPVVVSIALIGAAIIISGVVKIKAVIAKVVCLYLGFFFLAVVIICHLPYILIISPNSPSHLGVWDAAFEELAYSGGAFVMAGSFAEPSFMGRKKNSFTVVLQKLIPWGRIFFSALMIVYGISHFVYIDYVAAMVPKWFGMPLFWTYFCGVALIGAGSAIILKIWARPVALLLALMLFLWFIFIHVPLAIANGSAGHANETVRAIVALLFSGIALVIAFTTGSKNVLRT